MRTTAATLCLLATGLLASACDHGHARDWDSSGSKRSVTVNRNWPAEGISHVRVVEVDGSISIEAVDTSEITLVAVAKGNLELKPNVENQGLFETTVEGDTLRIGRREREKRGFRGFFWDRRSRRIQYTLKVPKQIALDVKTVNGRITTRGVDADTEATSVNGTIDVEVSGNHELEATTVNGRVKARFTESFQGARFRTVNGGVEASLPQQASFTVDLSQVNGDFEAAFPLSIHSHPGRRRVSGEVNGGQHELKIVTVNGDVELAQLGNIR